MKSEVQPASSSTKYRLICPLCQCPNMRRVPRVGFLQKKVYPLFGYYPWECSICRIEKLFKHRGAKRRRSKPE